MIELAMLVMAVFLILLAALCAAYFIPDIVRKWEELISDWRALRRTK